MSVNKKENLKAISVLIISVIVVLMLVLEAFIVVNSNKRNSDSKSLIMMDRIISVINQNEEAEDELIRSLKEDYIVRAHAVAYFLSNNPEAADSLHELTKLAKLISVDEIHLFDEAGTIFSGTMPKYYGLNIEAGSQISFFRPMLENRMLEMCQDVTPNTAESKSMMYAMVWNEEGTMMVQVGIEPVRLLERSKDKDISQAVKNIPVTDGVQIFVADKDSRVVLGATDDGVIGKTLDDIGFAKANKNADEAEFYTEVITSVPSYCTVKESGSRIVLISNSITNVNKGLSTSLLIVFVYLCIVFVASSLFIINISKSAKSEREQHLEAQEQSVKRLQNQVAIIQAVSTDYTDIIMIDTKSSRAATVKIAGKLVDLGKITNSAWRDYDTTWRGYIDRYVMAEDATQLSNAVKLDNVHKGLSSSDEYVCHYRIKYKNEIFHYQVKFVKIDAADGNGASLVASFQDINDILEAENKRAQLERKVSTDELTGVYNRSAYEDTVREYSASPAKEYTIIAMDVNGLKTVNDTLGHEAGDELIRGAADCIKKSFGKAGKVFRTGGDEFFAFVNAPDSEVKRLVAEFKSITESWSGSAVKELSVSFGAASNTEFPNLSPTELAKVADSRMYQYKQRYYSTHGADRRGQYSSLKSLCETYIKSMRVDLANDACRLIQPESNNTIAEMSFSRTIVDFLASRLIHEDDKAEFSARMTLESVRSHMSGGRSTFCIFYRRLVEGEYRRVMLEINPAADYSDDNMIAFLFVKQIDTV